MADSGQKKPYNEPNLVFRLENILQIIGSNESGIYCLSESTIQLAVSALRFADWSSRWTSDSFSDDTRLNSDDFRISQDLYNLALKELIKDMSCDINEGLQAIADSIALLGRGGGTMSSCCQDEIVNSGGGFSGGTFEDPTYGELPIYGTQPPISLEPETFPDGYETLEEYQLDKCQMANLIFDGVIGSLQGLGALGVFNWVVLAGLIVLAITGAIIFPPAFIPIAGAALGFLAAEVTILAVVASEMQSNRQAWVCALYEADGVQAALETIAELMDLAIAAAGGTGPVAVAIKTILLLLFNGDTLNQLFTKTAHLVYPDADCSSCEGDCSFSGWGEMEFGAVTDGAFETCGVTCVSENTGGSTNKIDISFWTDDTLSTRIEITVTELITSPDPLTHQVGQPNIFRFYNASLANIYNSDTPPTLPFAGVAAISIIAQNAGYHIDLGFEG